MKLYLCGVNWNEVYHIFSDIKAEQSFENTKEREYEGNDFKIISRSRHVDVGDDYLPTTIIVDNLNVTNNYVARLRS